LPRSRCDEQEDGEGVEHALVAAEDVGVHGRHHGQDDGADSHVDLLSEEEVAGVSGDVVPRHRGEHPESVGDHAGHREQEQVVDVAEERADLGPEDRTCRALWEGSGGHQCPVR